MSERDERDKEYNFSSLSERISAQTEAYVQFSNALVKIIEQTASIRDNLAGTNEQLDEECQKLQELLIDLNKFYSESSAQHTLYAKDIDALKASFVGFERTLKDSVKSEAEAHKELLESVAKISAASATILTQNETVLNYIKESNKVTDKFKVLIWAIGVIMTIFFILSGLHIVNVTWWMNK